jgi:hypothetical protein
MSNGQYGYGSSYHGPSNSPGLTSKEYREMMAEAALDPGKYDDADYDDRDSGGDNEGDDD